MSAHDEPTPDDANPIEGGGSHEIPPVPAERHITPAHAEFGTPPLPVYLWPAFWLGITAVLVMVCWGVGWTPWAGH